MKHSIEQLEEELYELQHPNYDSVNRLVDDSSKVISDGQTWGIVSDHGNVELCHKGKNGRLYFHGGLV